MNGIVRQKCSIGPGLQENALTITEQGLISVPHRAEREQDKGVLIDGTVLCERTMASFWSKVWTGRAFFFGSCPPVWSETQIAPERGGNS